MPPLYPIYLPSPVTKRPLSLRSPQSHVICTTPAAVVIKTYSPNLMVHPLLRESTNPSPSEASEIAHSIAALIPNLHSLVIGPGLGRDPLILATSAYIIQAARQKNLPLVLDADALWLVQSQPDLVKGYKECILTPNLVEFARLAKAVGLETSDDGEKGCSALASALGGVVIVRKGAQDWICNGTESFVGDLEGSRKRSGGQGDTLTGCIATMLAWRRLYLEHGWETEGDMSREETLMVAAWGGSAITRESSRQAFIKWGRSMQASDLTSEVGDAFDRLIDGQEALW